MTLEGLDERGPAGGARAPSRHERLVTIGIVTLVTLVAFEAMAVAVAMPVAAASLGGLSHYSLAFSLFLTTSLFGTVVAGPWTDRSGPRVPLLTGLALFVAGLVVCALAGSFPALLAGRAISGGGGGVVVVALYVLIAVVFPESARPRVFGWVSTAWVLPSVIGPGIAGLLTEHLSWRWVFGLVPFVVALPLATLWPALPGARRRDGEPRAPRRGPGPLERVVRGAVLALGATSLQWGLQGNSFALVVRPWHFVAAGGVAVLLALPRLVPPGTLRLARGIGALVVCRLLLAAAFFGAETFIPVMLMTQRGASPTWSGIALTASAVGWAAGSWVQGHARLRLSRPGLLAWGGVLLGICAAGLAVTPYPAVPALLVVPVWALGGLGMGVGVSVLSVLTLDLSREGEEGVNSSAVQLGDGLGGVLGVGVAGAVFAHGHVTGIAQPGLYASIWLSLAPLALLVGFVALRVSPRRAPSAPTVTQQ